MSNFIYSELDKNNNFYCSVSLDILGNTRTCRGKIDTGAFYSFFPLKTIAISNDDCLEIKNDLISRNEIPEIIITGAEGTYLKSSLDSMSFKEKLKFKGIAFLVGIDNLAFSDYTLGSTNVFVSCDTDGEVLIGMNILRNFDIHIGLSKFNNKVVFLGCLKSAITNDYLMELEKHFAYVPVEHSLARYFRGLFKRGV